MQPNSRYTLQDYCETATCAGVMNWYRAKLCVGKCFWAALITSALTLTTYQIYQSCMNYLDPASYFETVITVQPGLGGRPFPHVTVCNFNRINRTKMAERGIQDFRGFEYAFSAIPIVYHFPLTELASRYPSSPKYAALMAEHEQIWRDLVKNYYNGVEPKIAQIMDEFGHDCEPTFLHMGFQTMKYRGWEACERFVVDGTTNFGQCFTFNMSNQYQLYSGATMALQLIINPALEVYLNGSIVSNYLEEGILLSFDYVKPLVVFNPIAVAPGSHAFISLSLTEQVFQAETFPVFTLPCRPEEDAKLKILKEAYSKRTCGYDCMLSQINDVCGCIPPMRATEGYELCSINTTLHCFVPFIKNQSLFNEKIKLDGKACLDRCLDPCNGYTTVHASVTTTKYPARSQIPKVRELLTSNLRDGESINVENLIAIDAYFPMLEVVTVTTSEATPIFNFLGNLGGQLGMWTGMCIFTVIQAIYFVAAVLFDKLWWKEKKMTARNSQNELWSYSTQFESQIK